MVQCVLVLIAEGFLFSCCLMTVAQLCWLLYLTVWPDTLNMAFPNPKGKTNEYINIKYTNCIAEKTEYAYLDL